MKGLSAMVFRRSLSVNWDCDKFGSNIIRPRIRHAVRPDRGQQCRRDGSGF